ncbi:hypothetical protein FVE67_03840 [Thermosulfurimonas marina]|uniref:Uncharacterized protein n=1 Tax=Thermosulfurimonas marina TaxID=2047767 RepID=A0A6H1WS35_9BACT|nr:hypothetical protein [Thermosulfurimonas marina]QJA05980.1 hypothetical protein FVE67_03840 [Thermosulfurimonas marina]
MIKRYRTLEEAAADLPSFLAKLRRGKLRPIYPLLRVPRGIKKFRTLEEAQWDRERWILKIKYLLIGGLG